MVAGSGTAVAMSSDSTTANCCAESSDTSTAFSTSTCPCESDDSPAWSAESLPGEPELNPSSRAALPQAKSTGMLAASSRSERMRARMV